MVTMMFSSASGSFCGLFQQPSLAVRFTKAYELARAGLSRRTAVHLPASP